MKLIQLTLYSQKKIKLKGIGKKETDNFRLCDSQQVLKKEKNIKKNDFLMFDVIVKNTKKS